jgi:predicted  nucleic acid-binding Zn-ribbon protein
VYCHYFFYQQRPEDRILQVLVKKTETIKQELGSLSKVIDSKLSSGIRRKSVEMLETEIDSVDLAADKKATINAELEASRERQHTLKEQIERLRTQLENSRKSIGLSDSHFRSAISCSLELMGAEVLKPVEGEEAVSRFEFPALNERTGADPTWAETMDTLRVPRKRDQKLWDWRRSSPIRPVVFEDPGTLDDDVVHMHLEQRVVQRLLGRFSAQGFIHHDLSRACLAQATDSIPRVVLLGRLCLYGSGAARLHEELIHVTARWIDPQIRKEPLVPYAREAESKTLSLLDESLLKAGNWKLTSTVTSQLQQSAPQDINELLTHLETRGHQYGDDAETKLAARGEAEAKAMREILETQQKHIANEVRRVEKMNPNQQLFDFGDNEDELAQLDANKRYWSKRLEQIREELKTEPIRIQDLYSVMARRIEPVGLVYLWPVTG